MNAALTAAAVRQTFLPKLSPNLDVVYGVFNLHDHTVGLPDRAGSETVWQAGLRAAPQAAADFAALALEMARSQSLHSICNECERCGHGTRNTKHETPMNFTAQIVIDRPRERVVELIRNPETLAQWQPGWQYGPLLAGKLDQVGAQRRVLVELNGFRLDMIETIVASNPPDLFTSVYTARGVQNRVENRFYADNPDATRWVMSNAFQFTGLMAVVGTFVGDFVPKQTVESMRRFKLFAEQN